jgi:hypothetical protein
VTRRTRRPRHDDHPDAYPPEIDMDPVSVEERRLKERYAEGELELEELERKLTRLHEREARRDRG